MSDVNANISVNIDTSSALAELKNLQRQISLFHNQIAKSSASAAIAQRNLQQEFVNSINATGQFAARMQTIKTSAESFTTSLEKNKFSMREYFRYGVASSKSFGKLFKTEFDTIQKVAEERVRKLQTQYIKMGRDASGAMKAIAVTPLALDMEDLGTKTMIAAQKQQLFNQLLAQGTTNLINFGKNTQWAGRQLMVGFTIPLSVFGSTAAKAFMDLEKQTIRFKRVYGDLFTLPSETQANITVIRGLASEFTKYGVAIADTMSVAADAAAAGFTGKKLEEQVKAATKLSILGEVDKQQALSATIAIQTAFKMNSDELAQSINFLNAVENQSVVSLQNLTDAIPRVAPVIQGLGGDIKDMSVFLAAMQEGGVNAAEAANGLKSALASIINPSKAAREMLAGVNIDLNAITMRNEGNVMKTVLDLADAMKELTPLARQRILEQLFGKFQFARVSALFDNIARSGSQAANALELAKMSSQDLAAIANKELSAIEENTITKFKAAIEALRENIAPVGEAFLKVVTPIIEFFTKVADKFNNLSDGTKKVVTTLVTLFAGVGPVVLMLVGLIANFGGQLLKLFGLIRNGYLRLTGQSKFLGEQTQYLTSEQLEAEAVAHSLDQVHARLTQRFTIEAGAVNALRDAYLGAVAASKSFAFNNPGMMVPQSRQPKRFAEGGIVTGPGTGTSDSIPAMLSNGESVISAKQTKKHGTLINAIISDNIPGYANSKRAPGFFNQAMINKLFETMGLADTDKLRIPLPISSPSYSVAGIMAPKDVNVKKGGIGMDKEYLSSPMGRAALEATIQAQLEALGVSVERASEVLDEIGPQLNAAVDEFDDTIEGWQRASNKAITEIEASENLNEIEKKAIRKRLAPIDPDDYTVVSDPVLEIKKQGSTGGKGKATPRNERKDSPYLVARQKQLLKERGYDPDGLVFAHMPGYEKIEGTERATMRPPTAGGKVLTGTALAEAEKIRREVLKNRGMSEAEIEKIAKEDALTYSSALEKSTKDIYVESRDRKSPHYLAAQDGEDDANAYETARQTQTRVRRRRAASSPGGTVGDGGKLTPRRRRRAASRSAGTVTDTGSIIPKVYDSSDTPVTYNQGTMFGPARPTTADRLRGKLEELKSKPIKERATTISRGAMSGGMVASGAVMAAGMMPGQLGQIAQAAMPVVMGMQSLAMVLPMLTNPVGLAVAGVAALAAGFFFLRKKQAEYVKSLEDAGKKEAEARLGSLESIEAYSRYVGDKALPAERQFNRVGENKFISADAAKAANFRKFYAEEGSSVGNQLSGRMGKSNALTVAARDVAQRAAAFGLAPADIAANIKAAAELSGVSEIKLKGKVQELLSKDGKDITKEPLSIDARINYLSKASESSLAIIQRKIDQIKPPDLSSALANTSGSGALVNAQIESQKSRETQIKNTKFATVALTLAIEDQKQAIAILNGQYVDGKITIEEYNAAYDTQIQNFAKIKKATDDLVNALDKVDPSGKASQAALEDLAEQTFKGLEKTNKRVAKLLRTTVTKSLPKNMRTEILVAYAQGSLSAADILQIDAVLNDMKGKTIEQKIKIVSDLKGTGASDLVINEIELALAKLQLLDAQEKYTAAQERGSAALAKYKRNLDRAKGSVDTLRKAIAEGGKVTKDSPEVPGTTDIKKDGSGKTNPYAFVDDLLNKLKMVRKNSIDATKGVSGFIKALKGDLTGFKGTQELLRMGGATQGFIDIVSGLDAVTFKKIEKRLFTFTKDGKLKFGDLGSAIQKFTKEVELGTFLDQQQTVGKNADQQLKAYTKLKSAGVSATKITEILGNEALTTAVAAEKVGSTDWKQFISGAKSATAKVNELGKALKINAFMSEQEQETSTDRMNEYFAAQEAIIKQQARVDFKNAQGMSIEKFEELVDKQQELVDKAQEAVDKEQEKIDKIQEEIGLYNRGLELIGREEDVINKAYDERVKVIDDQISALEDVKKINQQIIDQQKQQTDLAGALSSGDIGAAAKIAQEMRASAAQNSQQTFIDNLGKQKNALELKKQEDLKNIQVQINGQYYTRSKIQDIIRVKEDEIYVAEQTTLKAAQDTVLEKEKELNRLQSIVDKYNKSVTVAINNVTNASGETKAEWESINSVIETTADWLGEEGLLGLTDDLADGALALEDAWKKVLAAIQAANNAAGGGGSGSKSSKQSPPPPEPGLNSKQRELLGETSSYIQTLVKDGQIDTAEAATSKMIKDLGDIKPLASVDIVGARKRALGYLNSGGLVPKYFSIGGFAKGSDTVPAMLTPGEFVMSKYAVNQHGVETLKAMNKGETVGNSVYTYNLSVNVKSDSNPNEIARTVMSQIKQIDSQRIRGVRQ